jgi:hypothetical protein
MNDHNLYPVGKWVATIEDVLRELIIKVRYHHGSEDYQEQTESGVEEPVDIYT